MIWMTARRFDWLLRTRGCVLSAWPERAAALRLLRRNAAARLALADALATEDAPELADPEADGRALARMQGVVRRALAPPPPVLRGMRWGAVAACVAAGLYLGLPALEVDALSEPGPTMQSDPAATVLAALD